MRAWEAKVEGLQGRGRGKREDWAVANMEKARQKVHEWDDNVQQLERLV